jgi:hypothetical protein
MFFFFFQVLKKAGLALSLAVFAWGAGAAQPPIKLALIESRSG